MQAPPSPPSQAAPIGLTQRVESLDWLRGLLAASIMAYHLTWWGVGLQDGGTVLGRLGIYGVSMFFILSGLSIAHVYHRFITELHAARRFYVRRVFRIWPVLWLAVAVTSAFRLAAGEGPGWKLIALNLTTLFGFVRPSAYINTGAWSIGNEMVYYAMTPPILLLYNRSRLAGNLFSLLTVGVGLVFSHDLLSTGAALAAQWATYINPFNNLFLYCCGIGLYYNAHSLRATRFECAAALGLAVAVFVFYPVQGDTIHIVTGTARIAFCVASVLAVLAFYKYPASVHPWLLGPLTQLGVMTYGVYLLHPVVWQTLSPLYARMGAGFMPVGAITVTVVLTLTIAWVCYHFFELPMIRLGKRLTPTTASFVGRAATHVATRSPRR